MDAFPNGESLCTSEGSDLVSRSSSDTDTDSLCRITPCTPLNAPLSVLRCARRTLYLVADKDNETHTTFHCACCVSVAAVAAVAAVASGGGCDRRLQTAACTSIMPVPLCTRAGSCRKPRVRWRSGCLGTRTVETALPQPLPLESLPSANAFFGFSAPTHTRILSSSL